MRQCGENHIAAVDHLFGGAACERTDFLQRGIDLRDRLSLKGYRGNRGELCLRVLQQQADELHTGITGGADNTGVDHDKFLLVFSDSGR